MASAAQKDAGMGSSKKGHRSKGGGGMTGQPRAVTALGTVRHTGGHPGGVGVSLGGGKRSGKRSARRGGR